MKLSAKILMAFGAASLLTIAIALAAIAWI
jgi:hypothetical protein